MRRTHVASLLALTAGLTASAALRRLIGRRRSACASATAPATAGASAATAPFTTTVTRPVAAHGAVVLPFTPRVVSAPVPQRPAAAARCGDSGGRTKAGAPCAARATAGGRCHHHRLAA